MRGVVYRITNKANGKTYVGLTTKSIHLRLRQHFYHAKNRLRSGERLSYLHRAMLKYGISSFEVECLASAICYSFLGELEKFLISQEKPEYNQTSGGEVTAGRKVDDFVRRKISTANKGRKRTPEHKEQISARMKKVYSENPSLKNDLLKKLNASKSEWERKRIEAVRLSASTRVRTPEEIEKSAAARRKPVFCQQTSKTYPSRKAASIDTGVSERSIRRACQGRKRPIKGYNFEYI